MMVRIVIPSRRRPHTVPHMRTLFPDATWVLDAQDYQTYPVPATHKVQLPPYVKGLYMTKQWILDTFPERVLGMMADDVRYWVCLVGKKSRPIVHPPAIHQLIDNAAHCADAIGCSLFGFNSHDDTRKYTGAKPFAVNSWVCGFVGVIGRKYRYETSYVSRGEIDFNLRVLEGDRVIWCDTRFGIRYIGETFRTSGGQAEFRTEATDEADIRRLKREWGDYVEINRKPQGVTVRLNVLRQQRFHVIS
jgi:hypothetical protein